MTNTFSPLKHFISKQFEHHRVFESNVITFPVPSFVGVELKWGSRTRLQFEKIIQLDNPLLLNITLYHYIEAQ
jgi:hypothetical protein